MLAESVCTEEKRRHRDVQAAIDDFRDARDDDERARMADDLLVAARNGERRFIDNMSHVSAKLIEEITGKSIDDLAREGLEAFGVALGPNGPELLAKGEDSDEFADVDAVVDFDVSHADTLAAGNADAIPGVDMASLNGIDFDKIEADFRKRDKGGDK